MQEQGLLISIKSINLIGQYKKCWKKYGKSEKTTLFRHSLPHFYHLAKHEHCAMHQSKVRVENVLTSWN